MLKEEPLSKLFNITAGGDIKKEQYSVSKKGKYKYPVYSNQLTNKGLFGYYDDYDVDYNSITVTARGTIGHAEARINEKYMPIGRLLVLKPKVDINLEYINDIINYRIKFANESTGVPQLTAPQIGKYVISFTDNIEQQEMIANTLANMDRLIDSLQKIIEKKEKIKNGLMQEYLVYKEGYYKYILDDLLDFIYGDGNVIPNNGGKYPVYGANGIVGRYTKYNAENEIVIGHIGTPGTVMWAEGKNFVTYNGTITIAKNPKIINLKYIYYALLQLNIPSIAFGSSQPFLSYDKLKKMEIYIPKDLDEQNKIEGILTNIDNELYVLTKKLQKYKKIKEGMMEDLLTGKVRLNYE